MYRLWVKWIIVGFAAVPPHAFADEVAGLASSETAVGTLQALGEGGIFLPPNAVAALGISSTALLVTGTSVYLMGASDVKRVFREAREQARQALARKDALPVTEAGLDSSLAIAVQIEKLTLIDAGRAVPTLTEREWAAVVFAHAAEVESL